MGYMAVLYPKPYCIYLRGTLGLKPIFGFGVSGTSLVEIVMRMDIRPDVRHALSLIVHSCPEPKS